MTRLDNGAPWRANFFARLEARLAEALEALESVDDPAPGEVDLRDIALVVAAASATIRALRYDLLDRSWTGLHN